MVMVGIDKNWKTDSLIGGGIGTGFIVGNKLTSAFVIGLPPSPLAFGTVFNWIIKVIAAPIIETAFFIGIILGKISEYLSKLFYKFIPKNYKEIPMPIFLLTNLGQALLFGLFHSYVYGSFGAMSAAYLGAVSFGFFTGFLARWTNSQAPVIISHAIFNAYLTYAPFVVVS